MPRKLSSKLFLLFLYIPMLFILMHNSFSEKKKQTKQRINGDIVPKIPWESDIRAQFTLHLVIILSHKHTFSMLPIHLKKSKELHYLFFRGE